MKRYIYSKLFKAIILPCCALLLFLSPIVVANLKDHQGDSPYGEIWLKLWEKSGKVVDLQVQIREIDLIRSHENPGKHLTPNPFQFDISELGNVPIGDIKGFAYGYRVTPAGKSDIPLMFRWWVVKQNQKNPNTSCALTLNLQTLNSEGIEFNPKQQQAVLIKKSAVICESNMT